MYVAMLSDDEKLAFGIYKVLRRCAPKANIITLRQISVYIARSGFVKDISNDIKIEYNEIKDVLMILLSNGVTIEFDDYLGDFDFVITRKDNNFLVKTIVSLVNSYDDTSVNVYSEIKLKRNGMYVVAFRPINIKDTDVLKFVTINYYTDDEIHWVNEVVEEGCINNFDIIAKRNGVFPFADESSFDLVPQTDMVLDCYSGYVSNVLMRIDLLYNNLKCLNNVKRKKRIRN